MNVPNYPLKVLDSGDYFILHLAVYDNVDRLLKLLYNHLDITLETLDTETEIFISQADYKFIIETCSRMVSNSLKTLDELKEDIAVLLKFQTIKASYMARSLTEPSKDKEARQVPPAYMDESSHYPGYGGPEWYMFSNDLTCCKDNDPCLTTSAYIHSYDLVNNVGTTFSMDEENYLIFYHTELRISVVVSSKEIPNTFHIPELLKHIPEFVWVDTITFKDDRHVLLLKELFDKKCYEAVSDIEDKIKSFRNLYNINVVKVDKSSMHPLLKRTEKERFKDILDHQFIINNDPAVRMKASELYKQFTMRMNVIDDTTAFTRRLQGYLIESGLHKKRYADGYYYYGIRFTHPESCRIFEELHTSIIEHKTFFQFKGDILADLVKPLKDVPLKDTKEESS